MKKLAKEICDLHLRPGATEAVNINSHTRQSVISQLQNPPPDLFTQAEKEVRINFIVSLVVFGWLID